MQKVGQLSGSRADGRHGARLSSTDQTEAPEHQGRTHVGRTCRFMTRAPVREDGVIGRGSRQVLSFDE